MSRIQVTCPECGARLALAPPAAGKKIRCPKCEAIFAPPPSATAVASGTRRPDRPRRRTPPKKQAIPTGAGIATFLAAVLLLAGGATAYVLYSRFAGDGRGGEGGGLRIVGGPNIAEGPIVAEAGSGPKVGEAAPEIAAENVDGVPFKLSDYRGKVVVLDFWGHW